MITNIGKALLMLYLCGTSTLAAALSCPDTTTVTQAPALAGPEQRSFQHWENELLSTFYQPFHVVHDGITRQGDEVTLVGKFDYDIVFHKDLERETVHTYIFGTGMEEWEDLGDFVTDSDGKIFVPMGARPVGEYIVKMVVEGDLSSASGYLSVVEPGRETVLFDIDGTLTLNDFEAVGDYLSAGTARTHAYAAEVVNAYQSKGYQIVYLTGRPYWVGKDTREWFDRVDLLGWHLHTNPFGDGPVPPDTQEYKTEYLQFLLDNVGLDIVRAYGNADTDILAYEDAGIAKAETYIIGEHAGERDTQAIDGDYSYHFTTVVAETPDADCIR